MFQKYQKYVWLPTVVSTAIVIIFYILLTNVTFEDPILRGQGSLFFHFIYLPSILFMDSITAPFTIISLVGSTLLVVNKTNRFASFWYWWSICLIVSGALALAGIIGT
jgi:hypothetical protein